MLKFLPDSSEGRLIKQFGELITFFCQVKSLLAPEPLAILQKIRYTDAKR